MNVAGIDYATAAIDLVVQRPDGTGRAYRWSLVGKPADSFHAARRVRLVMPRRDFWPEHGIEAIGLEAAVGRPNAIRALYRLQGAILQWIPPEIRVIEWKPDIWLGRFSGKASLPRTSLERKHLARDVAAAHGFVSRNLNACDAYGMAHVTRIEIEAEQAANPGRERLTKGA